MKSKSQVSLFMILGIVILIMGIILILLSQMLSQTTEGGEQGRLALIQSVQLQQYVESCRDKSVKDALLQMGKQGMHIYSGQDGAILSCGANDCSDPVPIYYSKLNSTIPFLLTPNPDYMPPPRYPCSDAGCKYSYDPSSPIGKVSGKSFLKPFDRGNESIVKQLEEAIAARVDECVDLETLMNASGMFEATSEQGDIAVEIEASLNRLLVNLEYPIVFSSYRGADTYSQRFAVELPIRLQPVYSFLYDLLLWDASYYDFNVKDNFRRLPHYRDGMQVDIVRNVMHGKDLIMVSDNVSTIDGKPWQIYFMRDDFPPMLSYVTGEISSSLYDYVVYVNNTLTINPNGFDVNEDPVTYSYSGWKQDYDEIFDESTATREKTGIAYDKTWEGGSLFKSSGKDASVFVEGRDIGPHELMIRISDGTQEDWQTVKVLVDDEIQVEGGGRSIYEDIALGHGSVEDPYYLSGQTVDVFNPGNVVYSWSEAGVVFFSGTEEFASSFYHPFNVLDYRKIDINLLPSGRLSTKGMHKMSVTASSVTSDTENFDVEIHECVPHRSNSPPYPYAAVSSPYDKYSNTTTDSYLGDHACCIGDPADLNTAWKVAPAGTPCYEQTVYILPLVPVDSLGDYVSGVTSAEIGKVKSFISGMTGAERNDLVKVSVARTCSGKRGNMCDGEFDVVLEKVSCADNAGVEQCNGPSALLMGTPSCTMYAGGESFEKKFTSGSGVCDATWKSTTSGICQSGCSSGGCSGTVNCVACSSYDYYVLSGSNPGNYETSSIDCATCASSGCVTYKYTDSGSASCEGSIVSLDSSQSACQSNSCGFSWFSGKGDRSCCGNQAGETVKVGDDGSSACCDSSSGCVYDGACYSSGACSAAGYCSSGSWIDPDDDEDSCTACGYKVVKWSTFFIPRSACCGDDGVGDNFCGGDQACNKGSYMDCDASGLSCDSDFVCR